MDIESKIRSFVAGELAAQSGEVELIKLAGDASTRNYYRGRFGDKSVIACYYPENPESLERYLEVSGFLLRNDIPVNRILDVKQEEGIVLIEDMGDEQLYGLKGNPWEELEEKLREGLNLLSRINALPFQELKSAPPAFDIDFWVWELRLFTQHYLGDMLGVTNTTEFIKQIREILKPFQTYPQIFSHRDYHSKNLMLSNGGMYVIDYQDARGGPVEYDLASFLRDAYLKVPEEIEMRLLKYSFELSELSDFNGFLDRYYRMSIQRSLKAVGTFAYQAVERKNESYLKYIGNSLNNAREAAQKTGFELSI